MTTSVSTLLTGMVAVSTAAIYATSKAGIKWQLQADIKKKLLLMPLTLLLTLSLILISHSVMAESSSSPARAIDPIVATQWLADNLDNPNLVVLDVRGADLYTAGHIAGSVNVPASGNFFLCFLEKDCGLWMELPPDDALFATIGNAGITSASTVVIVTRTVDSQSAGPATLGMVMGARVAMTLMHAGVENVAMLDGGYAKWAEEDRAISTEAVTPTAVTFKSVKNKGVKNEAMFVDKEYVAGKVGKATLVDAREADTYFGIKPDPLAARAGHIPTAKALPVSWFWATSKDEGGVAMYMGWKDNSVIGEIAQTILGKDRDKEIIVYCSVGGNASPVYYVLTELLGYSTVKLYDGSMQEWAADPEAALAKYQYQ